MTEIRALWSEALPPIPEDELSRLGREVPECLRPAAECFWLFRRLHREEDALTTLAGDYCFGRFSAHLAALDNVALTDAFAAFLQADTQAEKSLEDYIGFLRELPLNCNL